MMIRTGAALVIVVLLATALPLAEQAALTPMTPSSAHEALLFFEGAWTIEERPAAEHFVETCSWLNAGRRHMMCRSVWSAASGPREGLSIFSFDAADSTYRYYGLRTGGAAVPMTGRRLDAGWEFLRETGAGATRQRERVMISRLDARRFRLVAESAVGDDAWTHEGTEHYVPAPR